MIFYTPLQSYSSSIIPSISPVKMISQNTVEDENSIFSISSSNQLGFYNIEAISDKKSANDIDFYLKRLNETKTSFEAETNIRETLLNSKVASKIIKSNKSKAFIGSVKKNLKMVKETRDSLLEECEAILNALK